MAQQPKFSLHMTDGDAIHVPSPEELQQGYTQADRHLELRALELLAREIVKNAQGGTIEKATAYNKIPNGYSIWYHQRADNRKDWYIFGHPGHVKFDSFIQFAAHINHLMKFDEELGTCRCKACKKAPPTASIIARCDWRPPSIIRPGSDEANATPSSEQEADEDETEEEKVKRGVAAFFETMGIPMTPTGP